MLDTLVLKLVLAPLLILAASLAGRRWGQTVSGWVVGLPLTSAPIALILALDHGTGFAAAAALGSLLGAMAEAGFAVAYARVALRRSWPVATAAACVAFAVVGAALAWTTPGLAAVTLAVVVVLTLALRAMPRTAPIDAPLRLPAWDLPARMVVATALVVALTEAAPRLGPRLAGVLATFPVYAAVMTVFAHRTAGVSAVEVLRGLLLGLFAFAAFFVVLGATIEALGVAAAFTLAIVAALAVQGASLGFVVLRGAVQPPGAR